MSNIVANDSAELAQQLEDLAAKFTETAYRLRSGDTHLENDARSRNELINAAKNLLDAVQRPADKLWGYVHILPALAASRLFVDWKVFENIPQQGSISYAALANKVGAEVSLISE
jgi:hypothetical protein